MTKYLGILLLFMTSIDPSKIARVNEMKSEAEQAFLAGRFEESAEIYTYLVDSLNVEDDNMILNLGHSYFNLEDKEKSTSYYQRLQNSKDKSVKSIAYQQLGVLSQDPQSLDKSLAYFKESIIADPTNEESRYNYELVKKWIDQQEKQENENKNDSNEKQEPSEYAKRLKEQADRLVLQNQYQKAYSLMEGGLKVDPTVSYYKDFIQRTKDVADIDG